MAELATAPSADTLPVAVPKSKRKNAMTRKSSKKHKLPLAAPDAAPTIVAIMYVKDTPPPPKTCHAPKNSPVIIASYSDSEATEEWHKRMDVMNIFKVRFVVKSSVPITWTYLCVLLVHCSPIFCFRWNVRFTYVPCHLYSAGCFHVHIKHLNIHFQCCP